MSIENNIIEEHDYLQKQRAKDFAEYNGEVTKLNEDLNEKENLKAPHPLDDPGKIHIFKVLFWYVVGICLLGVHPYAGLVVLLLETSCVISHKRKQKKYTNYLFQYDYFKKEKKRLKTSIPQLKINIGYLTQSISNNLYTEINENCSVPISKDFLMQSENWVDLNAQIDELVKQYTLYKVTGTREKAMLFFNKKLEFFYRFSIKGETTDSVYTLFESKLSEAKKSADMNLLRKDSEEKKLLTMRNYDFSRTLEKNKFQLEHMDMSHLLEQYEDVKNIDTNGFMGFTNLEKLAAKTENLQNVYGPIKYEYERLMQISESVSYYLTYVRAIAYRNIYLGVELLNFIRDNAGGKKLMAQKDNVAMEKTLDVNIIDVESLQMNGMENISTTINDLANSALQDKDIMKFAIKNPKMAAGAAAVTIIGNFLSERAQKEEANTQMQQQLIDSISQMVDGYDSGKVEMLRAIEVTKALSKANIGFLSIYAPLRDKFFVEGCQEASMLDLQNLAKATQEYKHISDTRL